VKDFRTLATYKYMDKYMLWALVVVVAVDSGRKVVVRCKRRWWWLLPPISFFEFGGFFLPFFLALALIIGQ